MSYRKASDIGSSGITSYEIMSVQSREHRHEMLKKNTIVVIDVYASWCKPCKQLEPEFANLARLYNTQGTCLCLKENLELGLSEREHEIKTVPTFLVYLRGQLFRKIEGADLSLVEKTVKELQDSLSALPESNIGGYGGGYGRTNSEPLYRSNYGQNAGNAEHYSRQ